MAEVVSFRNYQESDAAVLPDLFIRAIQTVYPDLQDGQWTSDLHDVETNYLNSGGDIVIGTMDDQVVAMGGIKRISETIGEMKRVAVDPELQGHGMGQLLLDAIEDRAKELGLVKMVLDTTSNQVAAQKLYEKNGYHLIDRKPELAHPSGNVFDTLFYEKQFDEPEIQTGQLQLDGMEQFEIPEDWTPTLTVEVKGMPVFKSYKVSSVGQFTVPASARKRWGLENGGTVQIYDVGGAVFIFPEQIHPDTALELMYQMTAPDASDNPKAYEQKLSIRGILQDIKGEFEK